MIIKLYYNQSSKDTIIKTLANELELSGYLREECSIISPVIMIDYAGSLTGFNYAIIESFGRRYFITDITSVKNDLWRLSLRVDVLGSFASDILAQSVIIEDAESDYNNYVYGRQWMNSVKDTTNIINFPLGLSSNGHFILITAGG